jgi:L-asparaginase/Glu-tRNA(Gln) amidotransferase subunit D
MFEASYFAEKVDCMEFHLTHIQVVEAAALVGESQEFVTSVYLYYTGGTTGKRRDSQAAGVSKGVQNETSSRIL